MLELTLKSYLGDVVGRTSTPRGQEVKGRWIVLNKEVQFDCYSNV